MEINWNIIRKSVSESLEANEQEVFDKWLNEDTEHQKFYDDVLRFYASSFTHVKVNQNEIDQKWNLFISEKTQKRRRIIRVISIAASVIVIIGFAIWGISYKPSVGTVQNIAQVEESLVESDGDVVFKIEGEEAVVIERGSTLMISENGVEQHNSNEKTQLTNKLFKDKTASVKSQKKDIFFITLADGTKVWLNRNTELKFPLSFDGDSRNIEVIGEAYFEVAHNEKQPFYVKSLGSCVRVLGTKFNIRSNENRSVETTLIEGSVKMSGENGVAALLKPGEKGVFIEGSSGIDVSRADISAVLAWKQGRMVFDDSTIGDIMDRMGRLYGYQVYFNDEDLRELRYTLHTSRDVSMEEVINSISRAGDIEFKIEDKIIYISMKTRISDSVPKE